MNKRPNRTSLTEGVRSRLGRGSQSPTAPQRRISRRESEAKKQRMFYVAMAVAAVLVVAILGTGILYEYQIKPNAVLASVNGHEIKRRDYWKYESVSLYAQSTQYQNYAQQTTGQQQQQFLQFAAQFEQQRKDVWGSTDVNKATLDRMIIDRIYLDAAEEQGINPSEEELNNFALNSFASSETPLVTPIPSPTMVPERAAAATETAEAALGGTPVATPVPGTPEASPVASPVASATPDMETALAEAESGFGGFEDTALKDAHASRADYIRLFAKPQLIRTIIDAQITDQVPQLGEQVHAEHILVATEDLAKQLYDQANGGASFEELAKTNSTDATTSATGGDLGWITRGQMVTPFADAAFNLQPGQISAPVQTEFGWHIIKVVDREDNRPLTDEQYTDAITKAKEAWLDEKREVASIKSDHKLNATETPGTFEAPPDAPTPIPATPLPGTPEATPVPIGPELPVASPVAPGATPEDGSISTGTPEASPAATPAA
jgi:parvulin-like peptidyl-prolyl isomerase